MTWFSLNNHIVNTDLPGVSMGGEKLTRTKVMSYLGVKFDRSLSFNAHVDHVISKARKGLTALRVMAAANVEQRLLTLLFHALVLSPIQYAAAILTVSPTQIARLEKVQNAAMRIILGCTKDTSCVAMRYLLDFPTMNHRIKIWRTASYLKISADNTHPLRQALATKKGDRLKRGKSWMGRDEGVLGQVCSIGDIELGEEWMPVPQLLNCTFSCITTLDRKWKEKNAIVVNAEVNALISENSGDGDVLIYTDGSVVRHHRSAWAFTARSACQTVYEASGAYLMTTSSMTMEVIAVTRAISWLATQDYSRVCILSDSMSMIRRVEAGCVRRQWIDSLHMSNVRGITFIFVPSHAGVCGNERADRLAGSAAVVAGRPMDRADIFNAIREIGRTEDFHDCASASLSRLREMGIKIGAARREKLSGRMRSRINQHRTGTISRSTLMSILIGGSEHLWTCPEC